MLPAIPLEPELDANSNPPASQPGSSENRQGRQLTQPALQTEDGRLPPNENVCTKSHVETVTISLKEIEGYLKILADSKTSQTHQRHNQDTGSVQDDAASDQPPAKRVQDALQATDEAMFVSLEERIDAAANRTLAVWDQQSRIEARIAQERHQMLCNQMIALTHYTQAALTWCSCPIHPNRPAARGQRPARPTGNYQAQPGQASWVPPPAPPTEANQEERTPDAMVWADGQPYDQRLDFNDDMQE